MEELIAKMLAQTYGHATWWKLYLPGVRKYIHEGRGVSLLPQMSIWPNIADNTIEIRIKVTPEWMADASQAQKLEAMFLFADAWGTAVGLKRE